MDEILPSSCAGSYALSAACEHNARLAPSTRPHGEDLDTSWQPACGLANSHVGQPCLDASEAIASTRGARPVTLQSKSWPRGAVAGKWQIARADHCLGLSAYNHKCQIEVVPSLFGGRWLTKSKFRWCRVRVYDRSEEPGPTGTGRASTRYRRGCNLMSLDKLGLSFVSSDDSFLIVTIINDSQLLHTYSAFT